MKDTDFEKALKRFELSDWNDKVTCEQHYYNGFSFQQGDEAYCVHLQELYSRFIAIVSKKAGKQVSKNSNELNNYLKSKLISFNEIKEEWNDRQHVFDSWISNIANGKAKIFGFWLKCAVLQIFFIDRVLCYMRELCDTHSIQPQRVTQTKTIDSEKLKKYFDTTFKGMGNRNINYFNILFEHLQQERTAKEFAQIALMCYECDVMSEKKPKIFRKWHKIFCDCVGCEYVKYDPCKLRKPKDNLKATFYYIYDAEKGNLPHSAENRKSEVERRLQEMMEKAEKKGKTNIF